MRPAEMSRPWPARTGAGIVLLVALVAALCAAILLPYFMARWWANIPVLAFLSVASFFLTLWLGGRLCAHLWGANAGARFATQAAGVLTVVFAISLYWLVLKPTPDPGNPAPFENTRYWRLPTGSRIAYSEIDPPPGVAIKPDPVVYVHGGPGVRQFHFDQTIYGSLAKEGFKVFLYDQAGSGLSDFLPNIRDYTIGRAVEDLEAVRKEIGADKMILVGHSFGSTLVASYMAKHPGHVAKVIFHSPGHIWNLHNEQIDVSRTDVKETPFPSLRLVAALLLTDQNPDAAQNLVSQREAEGLLIPLEDAQSGSLVCKGDSNRLPEDFAAFRTTHANPGINGYLVQYMFPQTLLAAEDPHEALRKDHTPAILLYPECNYVPWSGAVDFRKTMPNLKIYYIPHAGHYIQFEQEDLMRRIMIAFLLDQPDVIAPVRGDADPRS
ncbi:MAG TPA: alpha/beta hydrolase [Steroidobacteraceae bacterium]